MIGKRKDRGGGGEKKTFWWSQGCNANSPALQARRDNSRTQLGHATRAEALSYFLQLGNYRKIP